MTFDASISAPDQSFIIADITYDGNNGDSFINLTPFNLPVINSFFPSSFMMYNGVSYLVLKSQAGGFGDDNGNCDNYPSIDSSDFGWFLCVG